MAGIALDELERHRERWISAPHGQRRAREREFRKAVAEELRREIAKPAPEAAASPSVELATPPRPWFKDGQYE